MADKPGSTIGVIGLWHLGSVLCASWSKLGNKVIGFDYETSIVEDLQKGVPPIFEPDLQETIQIGITSCLLSFTDNINTLNECDFVFLSYDTPVRDDDSSDTSILEQAVSDLSKVMKSSGILIVSSQSPVGLCKVLGSKLKEQNPSLDIAYSPENLRLGEAIDCYLNPGRIILGTANETTKKKCTEIFSQLSAEILSMNLESAEMVKHGINSFLATSIVFANHLADICEFAGARIDDVVMGLKTDPRIGQKAYLAPGVGFSGGTLGRDLKVLSKNNSEAKGDAKIFDLVHDLNNERKNSIVKRIEKLLVTVRGRTIGLLGLTYKPGTSTLRRSIPLEIAKLLQEKGANVKVYDPKADYSELDFEPEFKIAVNIEEVSDSVDALVLLTEWEEFKEFNWAEIPEKMAKPIMFDTKNYLSEKYMKEIGFIFQSIGR